MKAQERVFLFLICSSLLCVSRPLTSFAADPKPASPPLRSAAAPDKEAQSEEQPDNTAVNSRDRSGSSSTAEDQGNSQLDLNIAAEIRHRITRDKSLSTDAHNVKVIVNNGKVILRGPVASRHESVTIVQEATKVAGIPNVKNQLEIMQ